MKLNADLILEFEESDFKSYDKDVNGTYVRVTDVNKLLRDEMSKWPVVYGGNQMFYIYDEDGHDKDDTHRSRIAPPQPIKTETAEDVLRDVICYVEGSRIPLIARELVPIYEAFLSLAERARKVLK